MAIESFPLGRDAKVYYNTASKKLGDSGVETATLWLADAATVEAGNVSNVALQTTSTKADTNTRASTAGGFSSQRPVLKDGSVTFGCIWDLSDDFLLDLMTAWTTDAKMGLGFMNRDKSTLVTDDVFNGLVGNFFIEMSKDENVDDVQRGNFTASHADYGTWHQVITT